MNNRPEQVFNIRPQGQIDRDKPNPSRTTTTTTAVPVNLTTIARQQGTAYTGVTAGYSGGQTGLTAAAVPVTLSPIAATPPTFTTVTVSGQPPTSGGITAQPFAGAINLTISNGAINIKPHAGVGNSQIRGDASQGALIKTNIAGAGATGRFPMIQQSGANPINLKIPNPLNIRVAAPGTLPLARGKALQIGTRPAMLINQAQIRPVTSGLQNITQMGAQTITQLSPQAFTMLPQGTQIAQGMVFPQGARLVTPFPIATVGDGKNPGIRGQAPGKITSGTFSGPVVASIQPVGTSVQGQTSPMSTNFSVVSPTSVSIGSTGALMTAQPMLAYATATSLSQMSFAGTQPVSLAPSGMSLVTSSASGQSTPVSIAMIASPPAIRPSPQKTPGKNPSLLKTITPSKTTTNSGKNLSGKTQSATSPVTQELPKAEATSKKGAGKGPKKDKGEKKAEKDLPAQGTSGADADAKGDTEGDFDMVKVMEWQDGIGTLPGSTLKFRLNEFGCMEVVSDMDGVDGAALSGESKETGKMADDENHTDQAQKMETDEVSSSTDPVPPGEQSELQPAPGDQDGESVVPSGEDICHCLNCGTYGISSDFTDSSKFCSYACKDAYDKTDENKTVTTQEGQKPGPKKKKRKLTSTDDGEFSAKVAKATGDDDTGGELLPLPLKKTKGFSWPQYLEQEKAKGAPPKLFKEPFPTSKNGFKVGMRLEGIDPRHPSLYCVLSVAEVKGYRLRLHFDGYSECYDFWANADSPFIFPTGWVEKSGKKLQPPKGYTAETFNWSSYLKMSKFPAAPKNLFTNTQATSVTPHGFRIGMKLEAVDKKNSALTCVATVADVLGDRILVHFDGWEDIYDYWCEPASPYIHPVGWCQANAKPLSPPNDWTDIENFTWEEYLQQAKSQAVPSRAFKNRSPIAFEVGMKVELIDNRNPILCRVATIIDLDGFSVKIHFDGWSDIYDYFVEDDCPDTHPPGWCHRTGHPLTPPITPRDLATSPSHGGCPTPGCRGVGHIKGARYTGHHSAFGCPYSQMNLGKDPAPQDRITSVKDQSLESILSPNVTAVMSGNTSPDLKFLKCPTSGCDGAGHITGKFTGHHKMSGCPLADNNKQKLQKISSILNEGKPLFGPGSGRGRKKKKILSLIQKQRELEEAVKEEAASGLYPVKQEIQENGLPESHALHAGIHQSVFMSGMMPSPGRDLPLCWEQHSKLLPGLDKFRARDVTVWNATEVANFVSTLPGCSELANTFKEEQIDGEAFMLLNQADIVKILNVKLGPALKIYNSILIFKNEGESQ